MPDAEPVEILRYARDVVLVSEASWCKDALVRDSSGRGLRGDLMSPDAFQFCIVGAHERSARVLGYTGWMAWSALAREVPSHPLSLDDFNNDPDTTYEDVISLFDRAIKHLEDPTA